jgi:hypothetical protein
MRNEDEGGRRHGERNKERESEKENEANLLGDTCPSIRALFHKKETSPPQPPTPQPTTTNLHV